MKRTTLAMGLFTAMIFSLTSEAALASDQYSGDTVGISAGADRFFTIDPVDNSMDMYDTLTLQLVLRSEIVRPTANQPGIFAVRRFGPMLMNLYGPMGGGFTLYMGGEISLASGLGFGMGVQGVAAQWPEESAFLYFEPECQILMFSDDNHLTASVFFRLPPFFILGASEKTKIPLVTAGLQMGFQF